MNSSKNAFVMAACIALVGLPSSGCTPKSGNDKGDAAIGNTNPTTGKLQVTSVAFAADGEIPAKYTCEGSDTSPPLRWTGVPDGAKSLVLIVDDPDAPDPAAPKLTWVHWVLYGIPASVTGLDEGVSSLPEGTREGLNDWKRTGYGGPCPPIGRHRYFLKLYALDTTLAGLDKPNKASVVEAMKGHVLAQGELVGTYQKAAK